jgi:hypothetical protein
MLGDEERSQAGGFRLEMRGGPLAGGSARVRDTEVRLAVVQENGRLRLDAAAQHPVADGARVIGAYGFSHREEALVWFPALSRDAR